MFCLLNPFVLVAQCRNKRAWPGKAKTNFYSTIICELLLFLITIFLTFRAPNVEYWYIAEALENQFISVHYRLDIWIWVDDLFLVLSLATSVSSAHPDLPPILSLSTHEKGSQSPYGVSCPMSGEVPHPGDSDMTFVHGLRKDGYLFH